MSRHRFFQSSLAAALAYALPAAVAAKVRGRADQHRRAGCEARRDEARVLHPRDADREVESLLDDVHEAVAEVEVERDLGILRAECLDVRREHRRAEVSRRRHAQHAARLARELGDVVFRFGELRERRGAPCV
jgi:hypothetical protein